MFDCQYLYEDNSEYGKRKSFIRLECKGVVSIKLKENKFDGSGIAALVKDIHYVMTVYKKACKTIIFKCKVFNPVDKLTYILFETIIYNLRINKNYNVKLSFKSYTPNIVTEGILDSTIIKHFYDENALEKYEKRFKFEQNRTHFRRLFTSKQSEGIGVSTLLGELKTFFMTSGLERENTDQLAIVICELVDNVGEHTQSDCLIDIDISEFPYRKSGDETGEYLAVNTVVLNFGKKCLGDDVKLKIQNHYFDSSTRYEIVEEAYNNHKKFFDQKYNEEDFFNIVSFQHEISGRKGETKTGGTGLTQLIKSLEANAEEHGCYVLSGRQGVFFQPDLLEYNGDNWLGFNKQREFIAEKPDENIILRSSTFLRGTGYNFTLVYRRNK